MDYKSFLLKLANTKECQGIMYKRLAIREYIGIYASQQRDITRIDSFMVPFKEVIMNELIQNEIDIDDLLKYMIDTDESNCTLFAASTRFQRKKDLSEVEYLSAIAKYKILTPYSESIDMDIFSFVVEMYILDNFKPQKLSISDIVKDEVFAYDVNQYGLTKVNGAVFMKDGLIFDGKGYYYNMFTNKTIIDPMDSTVGFAKIIQNEMTNCDVLYRLDERLSMPELEYNDYTGVSFAKFYGPQFNFGKTNLKNSKTLIVHMSEDTFDKLLMVIKKRTDQTTNEEFWHIEIETLPYKTTCVGNVITTFLHGMYHPRKRAFSHIDYAINEYSGNEYLQKYAGSQNGASNDQYTSRRDLHYKIWCIENGEFSEETWYKLMIVSLSKKYQSLLNEMLE